MEDKKLTTNNIDEALYYLRQEVNRRTTFLWKMKNGQLINIKDMTDEHLLNTIKRLENKKWEKERIYKVIADYPYDI